MQTYIYHSNSPEQTLALAEKLGEILQPKDILTLEGDLGAGKTSFTKGVAKGLGIKRVVNSPTFTIIKEYNGRIPLYHMDVYRLENSDEDLGFEEYFDGDGVTVIEWPSMIQDQIPKEHLKIRIRTEGEEQRSIEFEPTSERYSRLCKELFEV